MACRIYLPGANMVADVEARLCIRFGAHITAAAGCGRIDGVCGQWWSQLLRSGRGLPGVDLLLGHQAVLTIMTRFRSSHFS